MQTFIMLTRLVSDEINRSFAVREEENKVSQKVAQYCPEVKWVQNYAILGPWDYVDVFEAPNMEAAMQVSAIVRYYGGAHTEIWPAKDWDDYEKDMMDLADKMER